MTEALSGYSIPVLKAKISQRVAFAESAAQGKTVFELAPKSHASREMKDLINEIMKVAA